METGKQETGKWHVGMRPGPMIYGPKGDMVANCDLVLNAPVENKANARRIVRAVNNFDALLEACKAVVGAFDTLKSGGILYTSTPEIITRAENDLRAAIAAAEKE